MKMSESRETDPMEKLICIKFLEVTSKILLGTTLCYGTAYHPETERARGIFKYSQGYDQQAAPYEGTLNGRKSLRPVLLGQDLKRKPMEFQVGDRVMLKLPQELSRVHSMFHVSDLKKCYSDKPLAVPLDGIHIDDKLYFVEEPVEIMD
ncbi:hypothetical protein Tco_0209439 [Tanacetum coccineum]